MLFCCTRFLVPSLVSRALPTIPTLVSAVRPFSEDDRMQALRDMHAKLLRDIRNTEEACNLIINLYPDKTTCENISNQERLLFDQIIYFIKNGKMPTTSTQTHYKDGKRLSELQLGKSKQKK